MYVRCNHCGWTQDDFWTPRYNPTKVLKDYEDDILIHDLDLPYYKSTNTLKEILLAVLQKEIKKIENVKWQTFTHYEQGDKTCPECKCVDNFSLC